MFAPNELVLDVQEMDAGSVLIVEYIVPEAPAITRVVPSVAIVCNPLAVGEVLDVHVVPFVDVYITPVVPTHIQAFICGTHLTTLASLTVVVVTELEISANE